MSTAVQQRVLSECRLKGSARMLMLVLANYADDTGLCWPGQQLLAANSGLSTRGVRKITAALAAAGEFEIVEQGLGRGNSTRYLLKKYAAVKAEQLDRKEERTNIKAELIGSSISDKEKRNGGAEKRNAETLKEERGDTKAEQASSSEPQNHHRTTEPPSDADEFAQFWQAYPRRVGKAAAQKAWNKLKLRFADVSAQLEAHRGSEQWTRDAGRFIPHPTTWLNQRRWEDDLPVPAVAAEPAPAEWENGNPLAWLPAKVVFAGNHLAMLRERIAAGDTAAKLEHDALKSEHDAWLRALKPAPAEIARADAYYAAAQTIEQVEYAEFLKNYQP